MYLLGKWMVFIIISFLHSIDIRKVYCNKSVFCHNDDNWYLAVILLCVFLQGFMIQEKSSHKWKFQRRVTKCTIEEVTPYRFLELLIHH